MHDKRRCDKTQAKRESPITDTLNECGMRERCTFEAGWKEGIVARLFRGTRRVISSYNEDIRPDILPLCPCPRGRISPNTNRCVFPITVPFFCCSLPLYDFNSFTMTLPMMFRQRLHSSSMLRLESILSKTSQISSVTNIDANSLFHFQKESEDNEERRSPRYGSSWNWGPP